MLIAMFFISLPSSAIDVEEITLDWTYEFEHGYITTAPVISDEIGRAHV